MNTKNTILILIFCLVSLFMYACNNLGYEIETADEPPPPVGNASDTVSQKPTAVQNNVPNDNSNSQNVVKEDSGTGTDLNKFYTIQIGAFTNELSAIKYSDKAKSSTDLQVNYTKVGDLYKIRVGTFHSLSEAEVMLEKFRSLGYSDSFISETNK